MQSSGKSFIVGILLVVGAVIYYFYQAGSPPVSPDSSLTATSGSFNTLGGGSQVGAEVLALLATIRGLNIDTGFFQSSIYQSLTDFSVVIPIEPVGKVNPFVPLGGPTLSNAPSIPAVPTVPPAATTTAASKTIKK